MLQKTKYILVTALLVFSFVSPAVANATSLNQAGVRLGRLGISASSGNDLLVTFKLKTTPTTVAKIKLTFDSAFTITTGTPTVGTTGFPNTPSGITAPPGTLTAAATSGSKDIIVSGLTSASLDNTTLYGFTIPTGTVANPATQGQYFITVESLTSGNSQVDTTQVATYIYGASSNQDQVVVTASVAPIFTFSLSANADTVPQVDQSTISTSTGVTLSVSTNAPLGYTAFVKSAASVLTSAVTSATIPTGTFNGTPDTVTAGTSSYTFVPSTGTVCSGGCAGASSITYDGEYNGITGSSGGSFPTAGTFASFVSRNGYTGGDNFLLKERVAASATQAAANDYTDTLTIVAAGNF